MIFLVSGAVYYASGFSFIVLVFVMSGPFASPTTIQWLCLAVIQAVTSKAWLHIGASSEELIHVQNYPAQRLFMNIGTWMSNTNYLINLCAGAALSVLLWYLYKRCKPDRSMYSPPG